MPFLTSIFSCTSDCSGCFDVIFCGPCNIGRQCGAVHGMDDKLECMPCILAMIPFTAICVNISLRRQVTAKYMIDEESLCGSILCGALCFACSVCQTNRELNLRGAKTGHTCCAPEPKIN